MFSAGTLPKQLILGVLLAVSGLGYALAQGEEAAVDVEVDVVKVEQIGPVVEEAPLTAREQAARAEQIVAEAGATCAGQADGLNTARREKDIIRATCIDDKLTQCNANLQNLKRRQAALNEATEANDNSRRNHEFTVIGVLGQKFKMLKQAANQCVGQDIYETGDTTVRPEVDPFAPDEDATVVLPVPDPSIPFIPPPVSGVS